MDALFDYQKLTESAGVSPKQLEELESLVRRDYGSDEMLIELRILRTLRAIEAGAVSFDEALQEFRGRENVYRLHEFLARQDISDAEREHIRQYLVKLPRVERMLVMLYYYEKLPFSEIAHVLDMSEQRVRQMHFDVIERLRASLGAPLVSRAFRPAS